MKSDAIKNQKLNNIFYFLVCFSSFWYALFFSSTVIRPFGYFGLAAICGFGIILYLKNIVKLEIDSFFIAYFLSFSICTVSVIYSQSRFSTISIIILSIIFFFAAIFLTFNIKYYNLLLNIISFFTCVFLVATYMHAFLPNLYDSTFKLLIDSSYYELIDTMANAGAYCGFTVQTGINALTLTLGFVICISRLFFTKKHKILNIVFSILYFFSIFLTGKRSFSLISFIILFVVLLVFTKKSTSSKRYIWVSLIIGAVVLVTVVMFFTVPQFSNVFTKFDTLDAQGDMTNGRIDIYKYALSLFSDNPITGIGFNAFKSLSTNCFSEAVDVHNEFIQGITELGIVGAVVFWFPNFFIFYKTYRAFSHPCLKDHPQYRHYLFVSFAFQLVLIIYMLTGNPFHEYSQTFLRYIFEFISYFSIKNLNNYAGGNQ